MPTINAPLTWELPAVAVIVTVVLLLTGKVYTANCIEDLPPGTNTNDGTCATSGLSLLRATDTPPGGSCSVERQRTCRQLAALHIRWLEGQRGECDVGDIRQR